MDLFFYMLKCGGSEGEFHLYCLYFPLLFSLISLVDIIFTVPIIIGTMRRQNEV